MVIANLIVVSLFTVIAIVLKIFGIAFTELAWWCLWMPEVVVIALYTAEYLVIDWRVSKKLKGEE